jgi:hypothetical protein
MNSTWHLHYGSTAFAGQADMSGRLQQGKCAIALPTAVLEPASGMQWFLFSVIDLH